MRRKAISRDLFEYLLHWRNSYVVTQYCPSCTKCTRMALDDPLRVFFVLFSALHKFNECQSTEQGISGKRYFWNSPVMWWNWSFRSNDRIFGYHCYDINRHQLCPIVVIFNKVLSNVYSVGSQIGQFCARLSQLRGIRSSVLTVYNRIPAFSLFSFGGLSPYIENFVSYNTDISARIDANTNWINTILGRKCCCFIIFTSEIWVSKLFLYFVLPWPEQTCWRRLPSYPIFQGVNTRKWCRNPVK